LMNKFQSTANLYKQEQSKCTVGTACEKIVWNEVGDHVDSRFYHFDFRKCYR